jgi:hypothetical protein
MVAAIDSSARGTVSVWVLSSLPSGAGEYCRPHRWPTWRALVGQATSRQPCAQRVVLVNENRAVLTYAVRRREWLHVAIVGTGAG